LGFLTILFYLNGLPSIYTEQDYGVSTLKHTYRYALLLPFNVVNTVVLPPLAHFLDPNTLVLGVIGTSYPEESGHASCALIIPKGLQGHAFPDTILGDK